MQNLELSPLRTHGLLKLVAVMLAGCLLSLANLPSASARTNSVSTKNKNRAPTTVTIATGGGYLTLYSAMWIAFSSKYLEPIDKKFHTHIVTSNYASGATSFPALLGGSAQFAEGAANSSASFIAAGEPLVNILVVYTGTGTVLVGAKKYQQSIGTDVAGYNGKTWCYTVAGTLTEAADIAEAEQAGLNWSNQTGIAVGSAAAFLPTLENGECDISQMDTGSATLAVSEGIGYIVENPNITSVGEKMTGGKAPLIGVTLATSRAFTKNYPAFVQAIVDACIKALVFVQSHVKAPGAIYADLTSGMTNSLPLSTYRNQWRITYPVLTGSSGIFSKTELSITSRWYHRLGIVTGPQAAVIDSNSYFTNKFVDQAYADLGLPKPAASGVPVTFKKT